jgi:hypothetical protein
MRAEIAVAPCPRPEERTDHERGSPIEPRCPRPDQVDQGLHGEALVRDGQSEAPARLARVSEPPRQWREVAEHNVSTSSDGETFHGPVAPGDVVAVELLANDTRPKRRWSASPTNSTRRARRRSTRSRGVAGVWMTTEPAQHGQDVAVLDRDGLGGSGVMAAKSPPRDGRRSTSRHVMRGGAVGRMDEDPDPGQRELAGAPAWSG